LAQISNNPLEFIFGEIVFRKLSRCSSEKGLRTAEVDAPP